MTKKEYEKRFKRLKATNLYTDEEIYQLILDDEKVDKGESLEWDLTPEQKKNQKKALSTGTRKQTTSTKRERKENPVKREIIKIVAESLKNYENVSITNIERVIQFQVGENVFEITLTQKRKK